MSRSRSAKIPRIVYLLVVLAILVALILIRDKITPSLSPEPAIAPSAVKVIDGDTFVDANGQTIRLLGIDTPEKGEPFSKEATELLGRLLSTGRNFRYEYGREVEDRYGRTLAFVYVDSIFVNERLLEDGLASTYFFEDQTPAVVFEELCGAQRAAIREKVGIWSRVHEKTESEYVGNPRTKRFHRPSCSSVNGSDSKRLVHNASRDFFLNDCYSPCRNCKP